jgi:GWxTD domain-containing protein
MQRNPTRYSPVVLAIACAFVVPSPARAQSPEQRVAVQAFRDSLGESSDSAAMVGYERRLIAEAKQDRDNTMLHLRLGFLALRMGDLGSHSRYDDAASEFQWATELEPTWPWGWYGLGIAEDKVGDSEVSIVSGLQAMFGKDHLSRAANAYARSVQVDPSFVRGLVELASTALRQRINLKIDLAREALRQAAATSAGANPEVLLYRGRVEREVGDIDSAAVAFDDYLARGGHRGVGLLELSRTRFLRGDLDAQAYYYEGALIDDTASVELYREDIALIANDSALAEFDHTNGPRRVAFLQRFWGQRDRAELLHDGERLREHYRRVFYARRNFLLASANRHYDIVERFRSGSKDFDDRGIIYIRHGEPTHRAAYNPAGLRCGPTSQQVVGQCYNESWHYVRASGDLIFHFVAREDVQDYKLVESVFDVLGFSDALALRGGDRDTITASSYANELILTRENFSPVYGRLLSAGPAGAQRYLTEERALGRHSIAVGTRTDSYELRYSKRLRVQADVVVAGRDSAQSLLHVSYAIPGSSLLEVPSTQGHLYPVRVRLSVMDRFGTPIASIDTTRLFLAKEAVPATEHLVGRLAVPVIPGPLTYRLAIEQGDENGVVFPADTITAGDFTGREFGMSGIVLGSHDANLVWRPTPADTIWFNPIGTWRRSRPMELYYEIYGQPAGAALKTELVVTKQGNGGLLGLFGGRRAAIRLGFEDRAEGPATRFKRTVSLDKLSAGNYWLEVTVTDPQGVERRSRAAFEVREDK